MKKTAIILIVQVLGLACGLFAQEETVRQITAPDAPKAIGPYSQAIRAGGTCYLSGQIAIIPETGEMDTLSIDAEVRRIMKNIGLVLNEAGLDYSNIVKTTIYTTDLRHFQAINSAYASFLEVPYPARETVEVAGLPKKAHVEISVVAVKLPR
jgi:2-iminobutanoate/2-iminopropanoate deaminase